MHACPVVKGAIAGPRTQDYTKLLESKRYAKSLADKIKHAVTTAVSAHDNDAGALLEILHAVQRDLGFIPGDAVPPIARALNLSRAEVQGVISFYHDFRSEPAGHTVIQVCRAEACQAMGVRELEAHIHRRLGINYHETTKDGRFTLEPVYCLGNCACTPSLRIGDEVHARVTPQRFDELCPAGELT